VAVQRRSFALIIVLIAVAAVFPLAMQTGMSMRAATIEAIALTDSERLRREARSAVSVTLAVITGRVTSADSLSGGGDSADQRGQDGGDAEDDIPELPPEIRALLGDLLPDDEDEPEDPPSQQGGGVSVDAGTQTGIRVRADALDRVIDVDIEERAWRVRIVDAGGRINLNAATERQLQRYLSELGMTELERARITDQILDWRDEDDLVRPRGAERDAYLRRGLEPRDGELRHVRELLYLPAIDERTYRALELGFTTYGDDRINALTAPEEVLISLPGMNALLVQRLIELRETGNLTERTANDALAGAYDAFERLRFSPTSLLHVEAWPAERPRAVFRGTAAPNGSGGMHIGLSLGRAGAPTMPPENRR